MNQPAVKEFTDSVALLQLWESAPLAVLIVDQNGRIRYANDQTTTTFGYQLGELIERPLSLLLPERYQSAHKSMLDHFFKYPATRAMGERKNLTARHKRGYEFAVEIGLSMARVNGENLAISLINDISDRVRVEQYAHSLAVQNADLEAFAHMVAHDLKNPIAQVIGFSDALKAHGTDLAPEQLTQYLDFIRSAGHQASKIIDELLLLASLRRDEITIQPVAMDQVVARTIHALEPLVEEYGATIEIASSWPSALGYAPWIEQIWQNYLTNGLKYGGQPPHLMLGADTPVNGSVRFWVHDNGKGIDAKMQEKLFVEFTRLQTIVEGHGLGLATVRRIADKLGGKVGVESEPGQGSTFYFELPTS